MRITFSFVVVIAIATGVLVFNAILYLNTRDLARENRQAVIVQCAQRADLQAQIDATAKLLQENPDPVIFQIPRKLIEDGQRRSRATLQNLAILDCKEDP